MQEENRISIDRSDPPMSCGYAAYAALLLGTIISGSANLCCEWAAENPANTEFKILFPMFMIMGVFGLMGTSVLPSKITPGQSLWLLTAGASAGASSLLAAGQPYSEPLVNAYAGFLWLGVVTSAAIFLGVALIPVAGVIAGGVALAENCYTFCKRGGDPAGQPLVQDADTAAPIANPV